MASEEPSAKLDEAPHRPQTSDPRREPKALRSSGAGLGHQVSGKKAHAARVEAPLPPDEGGMGHHRVAHTP